MKRYIIYNQAMKPFVPSDRARPIEFEDAVTARFDAQQLSTRSSLTLFVWDKEMKGVIAVFHRGDEIPLRPQVTLHLPQGKEADLTVWLMDNDDRENGPRRHVEVQIYDDHIAVRPVGKMNRLLSFFFQGKTAQVLMWGDALPDGHPGIRLTHDYERMLENEKQGEPFRKKPK